MSGAPSSCLTGRGHFPADQAQREEAQRLLRLQAFRIRSNPRYPDDLRQAEELIATAWALELENGGAPGNDVAVPATFEGAVLRDAIDRVANGSSASLVASS